MGAGITAALGISACATPATTFENGSVTTTTVAATTTEAPVAVSPGSATRSDVAGVPGGLVELFLRDAREFQPALYQYTDDELIEVALLSCGALDEGVPIEDLLVMLIDAFVASDPAAMEGIAYVIGGGIVLFCPHHEYQLDRL